MSAQQPPPAQTLILAIAGDAPRSRRARDNLKRALAALGLAIEAREIDVMVEPEQGLAYGIFATPALLRLDGGGPPQVLYGDLSDEAHLQRFLDGLGDVDQAAG